ncbi:hypothetical protein GGP90_000824 [Salinibacter ruber]|nr:hypothetical protein [Salinibacter ruber]MCS3756061.1 hypothetical protein [Salinibacter ruber]
MYVKKEFLHRFERARARALTRPREIRERCSVRYSIEESLRRA